MTTWLAWRIGKWLGVAVLTTGVAMAIGARHPKDRLDGAYLWATAGWLTTWIAGYGLLMASDRSVGLSWVALTLLLSIAVLLGASVAARTVESRSPDTGQRRQWIAAVTVAALVMCFVVMTLRENLAQAQWWVALTPFPLIPLIWLVPPSQSDVSIDIEGPTWTWFSVLAWAEGLSAVGLFAVFLPFKYGAGIEIDGGDGWFGWLHGAFFAAYLVALQGAGSTQGWSWSVMAVGGACGVIPGATFVFERTMARRRDQDSSRAANTRA